MKLRITHFYDPEPKQVDYAIVIGHTGTHNEWGTKAEYFTDHEAWNSRQVKPEFKGTSRNFSNPLIRQMYPSETLVWDYHQKALQHYEENRRRYEGFEQTGNDAYKYENLFVLFFNEGEGVLLHTGHTDGFDLRFGESLSVSLFEQICEENGIKLNKI